MSSSCEHQTGSRRDRCVELQHRMGTESGQKSACSFSPQRLARQAASRAYSRKTETPKDEGMTQQRPKAQRPLESVGDEFPVSSQRCHQLLVGTTISTKSRGCGRQRAFEEHNAAIIERVRQGSRRMHPLQSIALKRQRAEED